MQQLPWHLQYELTRRQRLVPHVKIWRHYAPLVIVSVLGAAAAAVVWSWWFLVLLVAPLLMFRGFFVGLLNVALVRRAHMDIVIEHNGLGFLGGNERWYFALDGLTAFSKLADDVWTAQHWNGCVVNIPADLLDAEQVEFLRDWVIEADAIRHRLDIDRPNAG